MSGTGAVVGGPGEQAAPGLRRADVLAALACVGLALAVALAPHLATLAKSGTFEYVGDFDEGFYLVIARPAYHGEGSLRDPYNARWQTAPSLYAWFQFVPMARIARALGTGPVLASVVWRVVGAVAMGLTVYALFRRLFAGLKHPVAWSAACALLFLSDPGVIDGRPLILAGKYLAALVRGQTFMAAPRTYGLYGVVGPLASLPALLGLMAVMVPPASGRRTWRAYVAGVVMLTVCVLLYFFYWTAAVGGLGMYGLACLGSWRWGRTAEGRAAGRREVVFTAVVLAGGLAGGSPQILANARVASDASLKPILERLCRSQHLPAGHPARARYVKNTWALGKLGFGLAAAATLGLGAGAAGRRLLPVWTTALAGYMLANVALVTGLEFENFHWALVHAPLGEILLFAGAVLLWDRARGGQLSTPPAWLWGGVAVLAVFALTWRSYEALRHPESLRMNRTLAALGPIRPELAKLGPDSVLAGPREANVAVIFGRSGQLHNLPHTEHGSMVTDLEVHERHALNGWLEGRSLDDYARTASATRFPVGEELLPEWQPEAVAATRSAIFRRLLDDPAEARRLLSKYRPDALLRPAAAGEPPRGGPWSLAARGGDWALWTRSAGSP